MAFGHHHEGIVETLFLNLVFQDKIKAMPQSLLSDCSNLIERPLAYRRESDPQVRTSFKQYPIIPRDLCDSQDGMQREVIKDMMLYWEKMRSSRTDNIQTAKEYITLESFRFIAF